MSRPPTATARIRADSLAIRRYAAGRSFSDLAAARFHVVAVPASSRPAQPYFGPPRFRVRWRWAEPRRGDTKGPR